jgi:transposase InsO family protein
MGCPGRRNRIARLMRAERLFARQRSKYRPRTTESQHGGPIAPNRLQNLTVVKPNHVWVTDATCILTGRGWLYLVAVLDVCTRRVIGWAMHQILDARLVIAALRMALLQRRPHRSLIIHSDRGMQFASAAYRQVLAQHGLIASMSRKGNCYDNAFIESFWSSLKYEVVYHQRFATFAEARAAIFNYIETFYNRTRLHSSLAYRSPLAFEYQLNQKN